MMCLPIELWYSIFKYILPIDIVNIQLTCKLFDNIIRSNNFNTIWYYSDYYADLLNPKCSDVFRTYDEELSCSYNYSWGKYTCNDSIILLIIVTRHGDLELSKKLLKNNRGNMTINEHDWLIECCVRSCNLDLIKYINDKCIYRIGAWKYALIEAVRLDDFDIVQYCALCAGYMNRHLAIGYCLRYNRRNYAKYLLEQGAYVPGIQSRFPDIANDELLLSHLDETK